MKFTGFDTALQTSRTAVRSGRPGAISTSAPAFSNARQRLGARHLAVAAAEDAGGGAARRGERLEAERGENARRSGVPGVRDHERARRLVQRAEAKGLVILADRHRVPPCCNPAQYTAG